MLNQKQRKGYEILQYHLEKRGGDQFLMVMTGKRIYNLDGPYVWNENMFFILPTYFFYCYWDKGSAGSGKSFFLHAIKPLLDKYRIKSKIMSFTVSEVNYVNLYWHAFEMFRITFLQLKGASAWLVDGQTFHSTLRMPYFYRNASTMDGIVQARVALKGTSFILIDELRYVNSNRRKSTICIITNWRVHNFVIIQFTGMPLVWIHVTSPPAYFQKQLTIRWSTLYSVWRL